MTPKSVIAFHLIIFLSYLCHGDEGKSCSDAACSEEGPPIRFPFRLKDRQAESCGYPGFELSCSEKNETLIEIPKSGQFFVAKIDYDDQKIYMGDPQGCMARRLINLTLTTSPFTIFGNHSILLNCSSRIEKQDVVHIDCLSSSSHPVYGVSDSTYVSQDLLSCRPIADVTPSYIDDIQSLMGESYSLYNFTKLSWKIPVCGSDCRIRGGKCRFKSYNSLEVECFTEHIPPYESPQHEEKSSGHINK
ncbi:hypothetical protein SCA6_015409, partial [Theobroma cacao]